MRMYTENNIYTFDATINKKTAKINYIGVKKSMRNQGWAKHLVKEFEEECKNLGIEKILIDAYRECLGFWKKMGFSIKKEPQIIDGLVQDYHDGFKEIRKC